MEGVGAWGWGVRGRSSAAGEDENLMGSKRAAADGGFVLTDAMRARLAEDVKSADVVLYMKGTPDAPQCGFSNMVIRVLDFYNVDRAGFRSFNVLGEEDLRDAMKAFSSWPTFPQLYVKGELVGGCDVLLAMHESDEFSGFLKDNGIKFVPPAADEGA